MPKVSIVTLGCPKNRVDSEAVRERLELDGFSYAAEPEDAEIVCVNTCGFIEDAKRESVEEIIRLKELKKRGKKLLVFGCLAKRYRDELLREIPEIDALWGVGEDERIAEYCRTVAGSRSSVDSGEPAAGIPHPAMEPSAAAHNRGAYRSGRSGSRYRSADADYRLTTEPYAYLKIADGCNRGCTFCVIPSIRGPFRSADPNSILRKAEEHIRSGAKELILVAQDIGSYGRELDGYTLPSLVRDIASISGDFWIRLLYLYPTAITDELLSLIATEDKICKYLDIPLQHSEDMILKAMGRTGTKEFYRNLIEKIRDTVPGVTLRTTFIVGFPGESEEDFEGLKRFIDDMRFERLGVFTYSREEGTPASRVKGVVPKKVRERRRDGIMRIQSAISLDTNRELVGRRFRALVDEIDGGVAIARLASQAPEIDGVTFIEQGAAVKEGDFATVEITQAYDYDLKAVVVYMPHRRLGKRTSERSGGQTR